LRAACSEVFNCVVSFFLLPEGKVLLEELDDGLGISESLLVDVIDLLKGLGKGGFTELASLLVVVHHLILEYGVVEGKTKSDWVAGIETTSVLLGIAVSLKGTISD